MSEATSNSPAPADSRERWLSARNLADLCALGAAFARGELHSFPGWGATCLDAESLAIAPALERLNRAGFLTLASQPGRAPFRDSGAALCQQRAFVCGFVASTRARLLEAELSPAGFVLRVFARDTPSVDEVPVSTRDDQACVVSGHNAFAAELHLFEDELHAEALRDLEAALYVSALDPVWGREAALFEALLSLLERDG